MSVPRISPRDAFERMNRGEHVLFVDSRRHEDFDTSDRKLPGAIRVPPDLVDAHSGSLPRGAVVVVYCSCPEEASSECSAARLRELGFEEIFALEGGFEAWRDGQYPLEMRSGAAAAPSVA